ncbi:MAG: type III-B CRISPR-associated protein Cas10/Cmr2 [Bacillota bacterium]
MSTAHFLHFSLGPVQGFVAQARRTRDFWAGSFILSYLAGHAMLKVVRGGGRLVLPAVADRGEITDPLLNAIAERADNKPVRNGPAIATLPNRFQARIPEGFDPDLCVRAVQKAWEELAEAVWKRYVKPVAEMGDGTPDIWRRQVSGFWEMAWVVGDDPSVMDQRKNWRSHVPPVEGGDKCTLMGDWQELSGYVRARARDKQDAFWAALRTRVTQVGGHQMDESERLCAMALIKRLLPLVAEDVLWKVPLHFPSTPYLAAIPWIKKVIRENADGARKYAALATRLGAGYKENPESITGIKEALRDHPQARDFAGLDGNCFFKSALANSRLWGENPERTEQVRRELMAELEQLGASASPFYAMLLMDGDYLGRLLRDYDPQKVSEALGVFSDRVPEVVSLHDGVTVYAGGDDVLALLPLEQALPAAVALRKAFLESLGRPGSEKTIPATISAAIVYAQYNIPLTAVFRDVHELLDRIAKGEKGRDSLALAVWKGAGRVLTWAAPWEVVLDGESHVFDRLVRQFSGYGGRNGEGERSRREFTASFFYNIRERLAIFEEGRTSLLDMNPGIDQMVDILAAEYLRIREIETDREEARRRVRSLLRVCLGSWRDENGRLHREEGPLTPDGALLVKFLAQKGVET